MGRGIGQKALGFLLVGAGLALLTWGYGLSGSIATQLSQLAHGTAGARVTALYAAGGALFTLGVVRLAR